MDIVCGLHGVAVGQQFHEAHGEAMAATAHLRVIRRIGRHGDAHELAGRAGVEHLLEESAVGDCAVPPNEVIGYAIDLHTASHVFRKGHRIAVQVQSSWFPLIGRNPQQFVPNIFHAKPRDYVKQTHKVFQASRYPSAISLGLEHPGKLP